MYVCENVNDHTNITHQTKLNYIIEKVTTNFFINNIFSNNWASCDLTHERLQNIYWVFHIRGNLSIFFPEALLVSSDEKWERENKKIIYCQEKTEQNSVLLCNAMCRLDRDNQVDMK